MGRSAKLHKRVKTTSSTSSAAGAPPRPAAAVPVNHSVAVKRRSGLKDKAAAARRPGGQNGPVLKGADYVDLMMGSRKKAREEAAKLASN